MSSEKNHSNQNKRKGFPQNWDIDFAPLQDFVDRMDHLFTRSFKSFQGQILHPFPVETIEKEDAVQIKAEVPGYRREDIQIETIGNRVKLTLQHKEMHSLDTETSHSSKKTAQIKERTITLPFNIPEKSIRATLENGILLIHIPKQDIPHHYVNIDD